MAIIHLGDITDRAKPDFRGFIHQQEFYAYVDGRRDESAPLQGPFCYYTYTSHHGLCIKDYERNGYDDSDFHMIVWNPETKKPENICFASTRGWSYPCYGSFADATPEVMAEYKAYEAYEARKRQVCAKWAKRREAVRLARSNGFRHMVLLGLAKRYDSENYKAICKLLNTNVRSGFRKSLKAQLINWLNDPAPKYDKPFSPKQMQYV